MKRRYGFTIVELVIVTEVIAILIAISVGTYKVYLDRSFDNQVNGLVVAVKSGAERYYASNNEYPLAQDINNGIPPTSTPPTNFTAASTILDVPATNLDSGAVKLAPCAGATCSISASSDNNLVYYITKAATDGMAQRQYTVNGCTYTFPDTEDGSLSFIIAYYYRQGGYWKVTRSNLGTVTSSDPTGLCPFTRL